MARHNRIDEILPEPDVQLPDGPAGKYATRRQLSQIYRTVYGFPISPRTLERWPLPVRNVNGRAVYLVKDFLTEAERRFNSSPILMQGQQKAA